MKHEPIPLKECDFSSIHKMVADELKHYQETGHINKNFMHWCFEHSLEAVFGDEVWDWFEEQETSS